MGTLIFFWLKRYLKQGRIIVLYAITLTLFLLNAFIYSGRYHEDITTQNQRGRELEETFESVKNPDALAGTSFTLSMPASSLRFIADNNLEDVPTARSVGHTSSSLPFNPGGQKQQIGGLWDIDFIFLISFIFSFLAIVLTFDSICGEKEQGTLKLLMSTGVSRTSIIISKILASMLALCIPLVVGLPANVLYLNFSGVITLDNELISIISLFLLLSVLLLFFFTGLGILVSSLTKHSITSLVLLLLIWVALVIIVPGFAKPLAKEMSYVKSPVEVAKLRDAAFEEFFDDFKRSGALDRPPQMAAQDNFRYEKIWNGVRQRFLRNRQIITDTQLRDQYNQALTGRRTARFSPTMVFNLAVSKLTATDFTRVKEFHSQAGRYKNDLFNFVEVQDAPDEKSPHILYSDGRGYLSMRPFNGDIPRFVFYKTPIGDRLAETIPDTAILFGVSMLVLFASIVAFNRYDVR